jgi:hypothetical protein
MIVATAIFVLAIIGGVAEIFGQINFQSPSEQNNAPSPTSSPTGIPRQFVVATATASPSNDTPGQVNITAEIRNNGYQKEKVLVVLEIEEPNGNLMERTDNTTTLEIAGGATGSVTFLPMIPLNWKEGKFNAGIDIYNLEQTTEYCSSGLIYPFTTPVAFVFMFSPWDDLPSYSMTVDGVNYNKDLSYRFYWYLGTNHTVTVPQTMTNDGAPSFIPHGVWTFLGWQAESKNIVASGNTLFIHVAPDTPTYRIMVRYDSNLR